MHMYKCMYVCIYICVCVYMYIYICVCVSVLVNAFLFYIILKHVLFSANISQPVR